MKGAPEGPKRVEHEVIGGHFRVKNESDEEAYQGEEVEPAQQLQYGETVIKLDDAAHLDSESEGAASRFATVVSMKMM
jgi:hypothetical protein